MKNVGYVLSAFPVLSETFVGNEMRAMQLLGHHITPIAFVKPDTFGQPDDAQLQQRTRYLVEVTFWQIIWLCFSSPVGLLRALYLAFTQQGIRPRSALLSGAKVACVAQKYRCKHLHAHFALHSTTAALIAARWLGLTVSFVGHGYDVYATPADLALKLKTADFSVAVCQQMQQDFLVLEPNARVTHIPCGIELGRFQYSPEAKPQKGLLFIGRLAEKKGLPVLLKALAEFPEKERPTLDIVGEGELKNTLQQLIRALNLTSSVRLLGPQNSSWITEHARHYTALVAPFQLAKNGDRDTGPLVLKEAMALGLPVISTDFMGCSDIVGPEGGYLIAPEDPHALAIAIQQVQQLPEIQRLSLISNARKRVEQRFSVIASCRLLSARIEALP